MNVCLATAEFLPALGGIATYTDHLAILLAQSGHAVTVLSAAPPVHSLDRPYPVVSVHDRACTEDQRLQASWPAFPPSVHRHIAAGIALRNWLRDHAAARAFDIVEVPEFGGYGSFLAQPDLPPLAVTCHGSYGQMRIQHNIDPATPKYRILVGLETLLMTLADALSAYSPANAQAWTSLLGREVPFVPAPWLLPTPSPTCPQDRHHPLTNLSAGQASPPHPLTGVVVGRLQDWKGALELAAALELCRQAGVPVRIRWIGRDTNTAPDRGSLAAYLAAAYPDTWDAYLHWTGPLDRDRTRAAQAAADFAVIPSRWDTLNYTALEAMTLGTPAIVSTGAGSSYLIRDGENGLTVPPCDPAALAAAIQRMTADPVARTQMAAAAQRTLAREFDPDALIAQRIAWYRTAIQRRDLRRVHPVLAGSEALVEHLLYAQRPSPLRTIPRRLAARLRRTAARNNG